MRVEESIRIQLDFIEKVREIYKEARESKLPYNWIEARYIAEIVNKYPKNFPSIRTEIISNIYQVLKKETIERDLEIINTNLVWKHTNKVYMYV